MWIPKDNCTHQTACFHSIHMASSLQEIILPDKKAWFVGAYLHFGDKNTAMVVLRNQSQELCKYMSFCAQILNHIELVYNYITVNYK